MMFSTSWPDVGMALITNLVPIIGAAGAVIATVLGVLNRVKIQEVVQHTNSMKDELVVANRAESRELGIREGTKREQERVAAMERLNEIRGDQ